jgi:hypothetical protein
MVRQAAQIFLGLVLIFLVAEHTHAVIAFFQLIIDAAQSVAQAVAQTLKANGG